MDTYYPKHFLFFCEKFANNINLLSHLYVYIFSFIQTLPHGLSERNALRFATPPAPPSLLMSVNTAAVYSIMFIVFVGA